MSKNIKNLLRDEIISGFDAISAMEIGSKERASAIDDLAKLYRLTIEESKVEKELKIRKTENTETIARQEQEFALKKEQLELEREVKVKSNDISETTLQEQKIDRWVKVGIAGAEIILPLVFYAIWMKRGFEFERTGTFTSSTFRGLFSRFKTTKK